MELIGVIIDQIPIKEKDAMVRILTDEGVIGVYARRIMSLTNPYFAALQPFSIAKLIINQGRDGGLSLSQAQLINSLTIDSLSYQHLTSLQLIGELILSGVMIDNWSDLKSLLIKLLTKFAKTINPYLLTAYFLAQFLAQAGWRMVIDGCAICQRKTDIVAIDFNFGGYVCRDHYQENSSKPLPADLLKTFRYLLLLDVDQIEHLNLKEEQQIKLLKLLVEFYTYHTNKRIKNIELI